MSNSFQNILCNVSPLQKAGLHSCTKISASEKGAPRASTQSQKKNPQTVPLKAAFSDRRLMCCTNRNQHGEVQR